MHAALTLEQAGYSRIFILTLPEESRTAAAGTSAQPEAEPSLVN